MTKNSRLKEARIKAGLSQEEFAEKMHVKTPYVTMLENGKGFSYKKARQMASILNVDVDWLFFDDKTVNINGVEPRFNEPKTKTKFPTLEEKIQLYKDLKQRADNLLMEILEAQSKKKS